MDLRVYYNRVREVERTLEGAHVVLVSLVTQDGGRAGVLTEAPRHVAAKQIAEGRARVSTAEEADIFHADNTRRKREFDELEAMNRVQFVVMPQKHSAKQVKE